MRFCVLYLCGLCEGVLCVFGDGPQVSPIDDGKTGDRRNNQEHKARKTGRHIELEEATDREEQQLVEINATEEKRQGSKR